MHSGVVLSESWNFGVSRGSRTGDPAGNTQRARVPPGGVQQEKILNPLASHTHVCYTMGMTTLRDIMHTVIWVALTTLVAYLTLL
jgi:hypothetical protein